MEQHELKLAAPIHSLQTPFKDLMDRAQRSTRTPVARLLVSAISSAGIMFDVLKPVAKIRFFNI